MQLACTGNASTISAAGLRAALDLVRTNPGELDRVWSYYSERTGIVVSRLRALGAKLGIGLVAATDPEATFYVWADFSGLPRVPGRSSTDLELAAFLRGMYNFPTETEDDAVGVAVVPGSAFAVSEEFLRLRFSCAVPDLENLIKAMDAVDRGAHLICSGS